MAPPVVSALIERAAFVWRALWQAAARHKRIAAATAAVLLVAAAGGAWALLRPPPPPPSPRDQTPEQIHRYMASKDFARQSNPAKRRYMHAAMASRRQQPRPTTRGDRLSDQERARLRENVRPLFRQVAQERMDKYFQLPPSEQTAYLDKMIDERIARRQQRQVQGNRPPRGNRPRGSGRDPSPARLKRRIENTPPEVRAKHIEFRKALHERMKQRGIEPPPRRRGN